MSLRLTKQGHHSINTSYGAVSDILNQQGFVNPTLRQLSDAVIQIRKSKLPDPAYIPNTGSFFKNPIIPLTQYDKLKLQYPDIPSYPGDEGHRKVPAGWLIDHCGWKGVMLDEIGVHTRQALVLVNHGSDSGRKIWELANMIVRHVEDRYGITLSPEVNIIQ